MNFLNRAENLNFLTFSYKNVFINFPVLHSLLIVFKNWPIIVNYFILLYFEFPHNSLSENVYFTWIRINLDERNIFGYSHGGYGRGKIDGLFLPALNRSYVYLFITSFS